MAAPGIIGTIRLAAVLAFALPLMLFGLEWLVDGNALGAAFVALGVLMLVLQHRLPDPFDPGEAAEAAAGRVLGDDE